MSKIQIHLNLSLEKRSLCGLLAGAMALAAVTETGAESVTLTTYYPAPSGVYTQMIVTKNAWLARDGGTVAVGHDLTVGGAATVSGATALRGSVDIGQAATGGANLNVYGNATVSGGTLQLGKLTGDPATPSEGLLYYNSTKKQIMGYTAPAPNGTPAWTALGATATTAATPVAAAVVGYQTDCVGAYGASEACCMMRTDNGMTSCKSDTNGANPPRFTRTKTIFDASTSGPGISYSLSCWSFASGTMSCSREDRRGHAIYVSFDPGSSIASGVTPSPLF